MGLNDWEEVKKLAADFQRTQATGSSPRLSDRNCIDIVKKLIKLNLLDVIFTSDGKEYITPEHLLKEIHDQIYVNGGRISLNELVTTLNVDYTHVEAKAHELAQSSRGEIIYVLDQLMNEEYRAQLANEINERLHKAGVITVAELTKIYSLPADFLFDTISSRLGKTIFGIPDTTDPRTIFTEQYLNHYAAKITGVLSAVTRPFSLNQLYNRYKFPEKISNCK